MTRTWIAASLLALLLSGAVLVLLSDDAPRPVHIATYPLHTPYIDSGQGDYPSLPGLGSVTKRAARVEAGPGRAIVPGGRGV